MKNLIIVCITTNDTPHGVLFLQQAVNDVPTILSKVREHE